jgi:plastocyanin
MKMPVTVTVALTTAASALCVPVAFATRSGPGVKPAPAQTYQVVQKFVQFNPTELTIHTGDTVIWTN